MALNCLSDARVEAAILDCFRCSFATFGAHLARRSCQLPILKRGPIVAELPSQLTDARVSHTDAVGHFAGPVPESKQFDDQSVTV
jgi:hypothetical protein